MSKAIYAFSGDPITYGHIDIITRAVQVFKEVVVAIGVNPEKDYLFSLAERTALAKKAVANYSQVKVVSFTGLLVDFAYEIDADVIVKGVRSPTDFEYEKCLFNMGESQDIDIETVVFLARPELAHISSSNVKQLQRNQGLIHDYVPLNVKQALEAKMSQQYIISITGEIGAGKTYTAHKFMELAQQRKIEAHHIDLDAITHQILEELPQPKYQQIRQTIVKEFGAKVENKDGSINRKVLGEIVFNDKAKLEQLNNIMQQPLLVRVRRELCGKKGLILLNAALIIESNMTFLSNNNVCLVKTNQQSQKKRLLYRDLTESQIQRRLDSQYTYAQKKARLKKMIARDSFGRIWGIDNSNQAPDALFNQQFEQILQYFTLI